MGCASCAERAKHKSSNTSESVVKTTTLTDENVVVSQPVQKPTQVQATVVPKSSSDKMVKLRYYGGGTTTKTGSGCRSCGGSGSKYAVVTTETIMFASEDSPNNFFKRTFTVGHDYWVTENQAEYLLGLTYKSRSNNIVNKFKKVE